MYYINVIDNKKKPVQQYQYSATNKKMQQSYKIAKNSPITYLPYQQQLTFTNNSTPASPIDDSTYPKILLKSIGDNWLQIYDRQKLIDVIALPLLCKMKRLCFVSQVDREGMGCWFWVQGKSTVGVGRLEQGRIGEVVMMFTDISSCSFVTNAVSLCPGTIINISQSSSGISHLNIMKMDSQLKSQQIRINQQLCKNSNITTLSRQCVNFISDPLSPTLNTYNLEHETLTYQFQLPQTNSPRALRTISNKLSTFDKPLIYTYCQQWLAISDSRYNKLVAYQPLISCKTATNIQGGNVLFSDGCCLTQYEVRRGQVNRMPKLVHSRPIWDVSIVGSGLMVQDDGMGLHFYF